MIRTFPSTAYDINSKFSILARTKRRSLDGMAVTHCIRWFVESLQLADTYVESILF